MGQAGANVERAATAALVAATMKLSEAQFKPLFLRLLAWASAPPAGQPGSAARLPSCRRGLLGVLPHDCAPPRAHRASLSSLFLAEPTHEGHRTHTCMPDTRFLMRII